MDGSFGMARVDKSLGAVAIVRTSCSVIASVEKTVLLTIAGTQILLIKRCYYLVLGRVCRLPVFRYGLQILAIMQARQTDKKSNEYH